MMMGHRLNHSTSDGKKSASKCIRSGAHQYNLQMLLHCLWRLQSSTHLALPLNCIKAQLNIVPLNSASNAVQISWATQVEDIRGKHSLRVFRLYSVEKQYN